MLIKLFYTIAFVATIVILSPKASGQTVEMSGTDKAGHTINVVAYEDWYVSERPSFPGGDDKYLEFINDNRQYPQEAYEKGVQGKVTCQFLIDTDGSVKCISLLKNANYLLAREAIRLLNLMPRWQPGKMDGVPVNVRVVKTIPFRK